MLAGEHASHRCNQPTCVNEKHIVVEPKEANEARKNCPARQPTIRTVFNGFAIELPPNGMCSCSGKKCIPMIEHRVARLV
jgi:hypothetical protein